MNRKTKLITSDGSFNRLFRFISGGNEATEKISTVYGYFDPLWTPAFLRRNEVMLRTETAFPSGSQSSARTTSDPAILFHRS